MTTEAINDTPNTELTDQQMDELVSKSEQPKDTAERAMTKEDPAPQYEEKIEFTHAGKKIQATREQLVKWAQQGYDYPQKAQKLNQDRLKWEQERSQFEQKFQPYRQIDEWANKNPDKWKSLQQAWQQAQTGMPVSQAQGAPGTQDAYAPVIQSLKSELNEVRTVAQSWQEFMTKQQTAAEDQKLDEEIKSIRDKYKDLDWDNPDENGKSLEFKVLEHAQANGIRNFKTAFNDFYHDELIQRAEAQAKQNVSKDIQAKTKLGYLGQTPTPKKGIRPVENVRSKSYNDIMSEIREELKSGSYN